MSEIIPKKRGRKPKNRTILTYFQPCY